MYLIRNRFLSVASLLFVLLFITCSEEDKPFLTTDVTNVNFLNAGGNQTIAVTSSESWTASVDQSWIHLTTTSGSKNGNLTFSVDVNPSPLSRSASINLTANNVAPVTILVKQEPAAAFLSVSRVQIPFVLPTASTDTIRVLSNTSWSVKSNQPWVTLSSSQGTESATLTVSVQKNTDASPREATLTIKSSGIPDKTISVTQIGVAVIVAGKTTTAGPGLDLLYWPFKIFVDQSGVLFISDTFNRRIVKWTGKQNEGILVAGGNGAGSNLNQINLAEGIVVAGDGSIYICDVVNHRVVKWLPGATEGIVVAGGNDEGSGLNQLSSPVDLAVDTNGTMYIVEAHNSRVTKWTAGATQGIIIAQGPTITSPGDIFLKSDGTFYIASSGTNSVTKWTPGATDGVVVAGGAGSGAGLHQLNDPEGVYVDANENIFVCDLQNDRVVKWAPGASAGVVVAGGNGRGRELNQLNTASDVWVDADGNILVCDQGNSRVVKWFKQ